MSILDYPDKPCYSCGQNTWWYSTIEPEYHGVGWSCGICSPPPTSQGVLKMRIIKGNYLLNKMRHKIPLKDFKAGVKLLEDLWSQVESKECLYIENGKKLKHCIPEFHKEQGIECLACRNDYWWQAELDIEQFWGH